MTKLDFSWQLRSSMANSKKRSISSINKTLRNFTFPTISLCNVLLSDSERPCTRTCVSPYIFIARIREYEWKRLNGWTGAPRSWLKDLSPESENIEDEFHVCTNGRENLDLPTSFLQKPFYLFLFSYAAPIHIFVHAECTIWTSLLITSAHLIQYFSF